MPQMNVSVTTRLANYAKAEVKSGRYNSAGELVRDALRRMELEDERILRSGAPIVEDVVTGFTAIEKGDAAPCFQNRSPRPEGNLSLLG